MGLRDLNLKASYDSGMGDNVLDDFYIKALDNAVEYRRIAGFFSSTSLAVSARGVRGLIENKGKMKLIVSPRLSKEDVEMIEKATIFPEKVLENNLIREIDDIENYIVNDHVAGLGWLMAKGILEIRVALVYDNSGNVLDYEQVKEKGLFHIKVGIIKDYYGDVISFSGSINETASGWIRNIEEFKVFKMWEPGQSEYCRGDVEKFELYWNDSGDNVKIFKMPEAVRKKIIEKSPQDINDIKCLNNIIKKETSYTRKSPFDYEKQGTEILYGNNNEIVCEEWESKQGEYCKKDIKCANDIGVESGKTVDIGINLFNYQKQAIELWQKNNYELICEMATGERVIIVTGCINALVSRVSGTFIKNKSCIA